MHARALALAAIAAALLAGCMMGPDYVRPTVDAPAAFRFEPKDVADTANTAWWKQFGDPVLDQLIDTALAQQPQRQDRRRQRRAGGRRAHADALGAVSAGRLRRHRRARAHARIRRRRALIPNYPESADRLPGAAHGELGDRPLGPHPAPVRVGARQPARHRRGAPRRDPVARRVGGDQLPHAARPGRAARRSRSSTLGTYAESVRLYQLQFKYGQMSQMNVSQAQSQYETAAAQIPQIESQIAQTENALSVLLGRNPGPDPARQVDLRPRAAARCRRACRRQLLERRPDLLQAEQTLIAANAQIGAAKALYFPTISLTGALGSAERATCRTCSRARRGCGTTPARSSGRSSRSARSAARWRRPRPRSRRRCYNYQLSIQNAFADVDNALVANQKLQGAAGRAGAPGRRAQGLRAPREAAVRRRLHALLDRAAGRAGAVPRRAHARVGARVGVRVGRQHLQGDGRRLGHRGRQADDGRAPPPAGERGTGPPPLF